MNKIGIYYAYWEKDWSDDFVKYILKASKLGFDIIELASVNLIKMSQSEIEKVRNMGRDCNIELTFSMGLPAEYDISSRDEGIRKRGIEYIKRTLEIVYKMEAKIFGGVSYAAWSSFPEDIDINKREYVETSVQSMKQIIKTAENFGIQYCLESLNRFEQFIINTCDEAIAYINMVGSPNLKIQLDTFHMNIEEDNMIKAISKSGDMLGHFHVGENNRKPPGRGCMPWKDIARALKDINYQGSIVMEPFVQTGGEVGRDIRVWRELIPENELDNEAVAALNFIRRLMTVR